MLTELSEGATEFWLFEDLGVRILNLDGQSLPLPLGFVAEDDPVRGVTPFAGGVLLKTHSGQLLRA